MSVSYTHLDVYKRQGLRLGELCGLQWQDVDVDAGLLHIQRTVERIAQIGGGTLSLIHI